VLTEESAVGVEGINSLAEIGHSGVGRGCSGVTSVVVMLSIVVIVVVIQGVMALRDILSFKSCGGGSEKRCSENFH